jgi:hypothetical protein
MPMLINGESLETQKKKRKKERKKIQSNMFRKCIIDHKMIYYD